MAICVGVICALAAVALKASVHWIQHYLQYEVNFPYHTSLYFIFPGIGIFLTVLLVQRVLNGKLGRGISPILFNISRKRSKIEKHKTWSHLATSALTAGFGGSAGLEAPIVVTGSAIGSNIGQLLRLNYRERTLLLGCGAAAGIAAVFNCPIAGVIFALEVLLDGFTIPAFIPLLVAAATSTVVSRTLYSGQLFYLISDEWFITSIPFYILLGTLGGILSAYMTRTTLFIESSFKKSKRVYLKVLLGGLMLGVLTFLIPPLYGEGYSTLQQLFNGNGLTLFHNSVFYANEISAWGILVMVVIIVFLKVVATSLTIGSGGNGGIFAPSLFTGGVLGFGVAYGVNLLNLVYLPISNFVAAGMAAILSGVIHAPLTAIFLIAEITGGYSLFIPLMIVSSSAFFISRVFEPYSVYTTRLAKKGVWSKQNRDYAILRSMRLKTYLRKNVECFHPDMELKIVLPIIASSHHDIFPIIDEDNFLLGTIQIDDLKTFFLDAELSKEKHVKNVMKIADLVVQLNDSMTVVIDLFEQTNLNELPVADGGKYVGMISKSDTFAGYRNKLIKQSKELS
jgi:CIC family chloride channel protein